MTVNTSNMGVEANLTWALAEDDQWILISNPDEVIKIASEHFANNAKEEAIDIIRKNFKLVIPGSHWLQLPQEAEDLLWTIAGSYCDNPDKAMKVVEGVCDLTRHSQEVLTKIARSYLVAKNNKEKALEVTDRITNRHDYPLRKGELLMQIAYSYYPDVGDPQKAAVEGDRKSAIEVMEKVSLNPLDVNQKNLLLARMARDCIFIGENDNALNIIEKMDPEDSCMGPIKDGILLDVAHSYCRKKNLEKALAVVRHTSYNQGQENPTLDKIVQAYRDQGDQKNASEIARLKNPTLRREWKATLKMQKGLGKTRAQ